MKKTATKKKTAPQKSAKSVLIKVGKPAAPKALLAKSEPPAVRIENPKGRAKCVIVCDHAANRVPKALKNLGLSKTNLNKHIAWDPGTEDIGRYISKKLNAALVLASYSRLVVDLNRGDDHPEIMRDTSDHVFIPGNAKLTEPEKQQRMDTLFWPYHEQISSQLKRFTDKGIAPVLVSVHSFTPQMDGFRRPWHIGVLWNREEKLALQLVKALRRNNPDLVIGENEPYSLKEANYLKNTISTHAEAQGLPYIILEFRQDLVNTKKKADKWAEIFLESLKTVLADPALYVLKKGKAKR